MPVICHVTPHLPPDQAANALLPAHLGAWAADAGDRGGVSRASAARGRAGAGRRSGDVVAAVAGRRHRSRRCGSPRWRRAPHRPGSGAAARRGRRWCTCTATGCSPRSMRAAGARGAGCPIVLTLYGTEIWHYRPKRIVDLFTRDVPQRVGGHVLQPRPARQGARARARRGPACRVVYPPVVERFAAGRRGERAPRCGSGSA